MIASTLFFLVVTSHVLIKHCSLLVLCRHARSSRHWQEPSFRSPSGSEFAKVIPGGITVLPSGRLLSPVGNRFYSGEDLWNVVPSPDGKRIIALCDQGIDIYSTEPLVGRPLSFRIPWRNAAFCAVFTKDGSKLITSSGDASHGIQVFDPTAWKSLPVERLEPLDHQPIQSITADKEAYINDIVLSPDERHVFGADVARQCIVVFDIVVGKVVADVPAELPDAKSTL